MSFKINSYSILISNIEVILKRKPANQTEQPHVKSS